MATTEEMNVVKYCKLKITDKAMSAFMYAVIRCGCKVKQTYSHSVKMYNRKQSSGFLVEVLIEINPIMIDLFNELSGVKLSDGQKVHVNGNL